VYFKSIILFKKFLFKEGKFQKKFFVKHNCYLLKVKSKLSNREYFVSSRINIFLRHACMHVHLHTYIHIKYFSMPLENFILIKRRRKTIIAQNRGLARRSCVVIAACNKQLPVRLTTSMAKRPHLVARLH